MMSPKISINKLGEFLTTSSPVRRRGIIRDQKKPNKAAVPRYRQAVPPIEIYLNSGGADVVAILTEIDRLRSVKPSSDWVADDNENTALALEQFLEVADELLIDGVEYTRGDNSPPKLEIAGVHVSVRPDFLLHFDRRGKKYCGAVKFHFIKSEDHSLGKDGQEYVATLLHQWLTINATDGQLPSHKHCLSVDVFRQRVVPAPAAYTKRMGDVQAGCEEVALMWPQLP